MPSSSLLQNVLQNPNVDDLGLSWAPRWLELAMALKGTLNYGVWYAVKIMCRDTEPALIGLVLSLLIAMAVNDTIRVGILSALGL